MDMKSPRVREDGHWLPPMTSFAQNFEDVLLRRALQDIEHGFYVDIGASDPTVHSVTRWFYNCGWRGVNVEPNPEAFAQLVERRPRDINLDCAIGMPRDDGRLWISNGVGLSRLQGPDDGPALPEGYSFVDSVAVKMLSLDQLLETYCKEQVVDFLKVDVEGAETEIIVHAAFTTYRPRIIVVEATKVNCQEPAWDGWEPLLLQRGYLFAYFDGLNRYYLRDEDGWRKDYFQLPPCVFDNFVFDQSEHFKRVVEMQRAIAELTAQLDAARVQLASVETARDEMVRLAEDRLDLITAQNELMTEQHRQLMKAHGELARPLHRLISAVLPAK